MSLCSKKQAILSILIAWCNITQSFVSTERRIRGMLLRAIPSSDIPTLQTQDTRGEQVHLCIPKPLGIVLEQKDDSSGVYVIQVNPDGNAASAAGVLCVRDHVQAVQGQDVSTQSLDYIMDMIIRACDPVELVVQRPSAESVVVRWSQKGVCVAAQPGEYLGNIAQEAGIYDIPYSCRSGSCGTCEQSVYCIKDKSGEGKQKFCRPCSFRIPKGIRSMTVSSSDRVWGTP